MSDAQDEFEIGDDELPSREACRAAGEVYGAILADPDEAARLRAARERYDAARVAS